MWQPAYTTSDVSGYRSPSGGSVSPTTTSSNFASVIMRHPVQWAIDVGFAIDREQFAALIGVAGFRHDKDHRPVLRVFRS